MKEVNAGSTAHLAVGWEDATGTAIADTPTSATYSIRCLTTGAVVRASTAFPTLAPNVDILLSAADTALQRAANRTEVKQVTTIVDFGGTGERLTAEFEYMVRRIALP